MRLEATNFGGKRAREVKATDINSFQAVIYLAKEARVMRNLNGWEKAGVGNGAQRTVYDIIYEEGQGPPNMPIAVLVQFGTVNKGEICRGHSYVALLDCKRTHFYSRLGLRNDGDP